MGKKNIQNAIKPKVGRFKIFFVSTSRLNKVIAISLAGATWKPGRTIGSWVQLALPDYLGWLGTVEPCIHDNLCRSSGWGRTIPVTVHDYFKCTKVYLSQMLCRDFPGNPWIFQGNSWESHGIPSFIWQRCTTVNMLPICRVWVIKSRASAPLSEK